MGSYKNNLDILLKGLECIDNNIPKLIKFDDIIYSNIYSNSKKGERYVYVLILEHNKYYIGYTSDLKRTMEDTFYKVNGVLISRHRPIKVLRIFKGHREESRIEKLRLIRIYGEENVKGRMKCSIE